MTNVQENRNTKRFAQRFSMKGFGAEIVEKDADEQEESMLKGMKKVLEETIPDAVDLIVAKKFEEFQTAQAKDIEEMKNQLKMLSNNQRFSAEGKAMITKTAIVAIAKDVYKSNAQNPDDFNRIAQKHFADLGLKVMGEADASEGAEFVFDQFEKDILVVINTFELVNHVKILPLAKGDKLLIPKVTNGITTAYVTEAGVVGAATEPVTAFVQFDIFKTVTLTNVTEELMEDTMTIPQLYDFLVQEIGESQGEFLEGEIISGAGTTAIEGVLTASGTNSVVLGAGLTSSSIGDTVLVTAMTTAAMKYKRIAANIGWVMSQYIFGKLYALKTTDGYPLYPELRNPQPTLLGYKVIKSDKMPAQNLAGDTANIKTIIFGDLTYFMLVIRKGLTIDRGYYGDNWKNGVQSLKSQRRQGGKCTFPPAFTIIKNGS